MEKAIIISNNPLVWERYPGAVQISGSYKDVLISARDYIHRGSSLLNHPLAGSIKPNETPYKTLILKLGQGELDYDSLGLIESGIEVSEKFPFKEKNWSEQVIEDFQMIDGELLNSALAALSPGLILKI